VRVVYASVRTIPTVAALAGCATYCVPDWIMGTVVLVRFLRTLPILLVSVLIAVLGFLAPDLPMRVETAPTTTSTSLPPTTFTTLPDPRPTPAFPVIAAAGDIACAPEELAVDPFDRSEPCAQEQTAGLLESGPSIQPGSPYAAVFALGDLQYHKGTLEEFLGSYDHSWGNHLDRTWPVLGNHEMLDQARGYREYFATLDLRADMVGSVTQGWYALRLGSWLVIGLNSNCASGICDAGSEQVEFLRAILTLDKGPCTLALMHHPRWSSGRHGDDERVDPLWQVLAEFGVDVVLSGHDHHYERFAPRTAEGSFGPGPVQYVVGTGGAPLLPAQPSRLGATSVLDRHGIVELTLEDSGWSGRFRSIDGSTQDQHRSHCTARSTSATSLSASGVMPAGTRTATTVSVPR
jgi:hypothetical protein